MTIYYQPCWWSDSWDGVEYAMEYNPARPFLAQLKELSEKTPYSALETEYVTLKKVNNKKNMVKFSCYYNEIQ